MPSELAPYLPCGLNIPILAPPVLQIALCHSPGATRTTATCKHGSWLVAIATPVYWSLRFPNRLKISSRWPRIQLVTFRAKLVNAQNFSWTMWRHIVPCKMTWPRTNSSLWHLEMVHKRGTEPYPKISSRIGLSLKRYSSTVIALPSSWTLYK